MPPLLAALAIVPSATAAPPRVLMTGDSTIDSIATVAKQRLDRKLGEARIIHDGRPGEGISKSWRTNWVKYSRIQMRRYRPRATVMMLGANEGFAMLDDRGREVACCRLAWIEAYARDAGRMMETYASRGRFVYWLTFPAPNNEYRRRIGLAVNYALRLAARRVERVRLLDMVGLFTPGYEYRQRMDMDGERVVVREPDGVHLNENGATLALREIRWALLADGVIR
ncbi:MAG: GDSL-type esterase/lipase family protein [Thermoleophilaceae bacterium]